MTFLWPCRNKRGPGRCSKYFYDMLLKFGIEGSRGQVLSEWEWARYQPSLLEKNYLSSPGVLLPLYLSWLYALCIAKMMFYNIFIMNNGCKIRQRNKGALPGANSRKSRPRPGPTTSHNTHKKRREHKTHEMQIVNYKFAIKIFNRMKHFAFMSLSFGWEFICFYDNVMCARSQKAGAESQELPRPHHHFLVLFLFVVTVLH